MADMMDKLANGSITDMKQYTPVFTKANVEAMLNGDPTDGQECQLQLIKVFAPVSIRSITSPYRVVVTKCVISRLSAIWDAGMVILITA
ncbi:hypothetical protein NXW14_23910 [Bacteroides thetaiotaomicron]|nr:hypothetical protein [Bacteroides thetaiotaomicron]MCS2191279.1 hypothetical protein [Bacteroides thetaiotaomicron]